MFATKQKINKLLGLNESIIFYPNENFYIPTLFFYKTIISFFCLICKVYNIKYTKTFNCVRHAELFKIICYYYYNKIYLTKKEESVSVGNVFYVKEDGVPHAINICIYKEKENIFYVFFEPQSQKIISLSNKEFENIKYIIF